MSWSETAEANRLRKLAELQENLELAVQARRADVGGAVAADAPHKTTPARGRCQVSGVRCQVSGVRCQVNTVSVQILR